MSAKVIKINDKRSPQNEHEATIARENAGWVREFLASTKPLSGCCFCGSESFHTGRAAVERIALALERQDNSLLPNANECVDLLTWLTCIEPVDAEHYCHGCSGKGGYSVVLGVARDVIADALESQEMANG